MDMAQKNATVEMNFFKPFHFNSVIFATLCLLIKGMFKGGKQSPIKKLRHLHGGAVSFCLL